MGFKDFMETAEQVPQLKPGYTIGGPGARNHVFTGKTKIGKHGRKTFLLFQVRWEWPEGSKTWDGQPSGPQYDWVPEYSLVVLPKVAGRRSGK